METAKTTVRSCAWYRGGPGASRTEMRRWVAAVLLVAVASVAWGLDGRRLRELDGRLVDQHRREVTLRGVNARVEGIFDVTFSDGRQPLEAIPPFDDGDAAKME